MALYCTNVLMLARNYPRQKTIAIQIRKLIYAKGKLTQ